MNRPTEPMVEPVSKPSPSFDMLLDQLTEKIQRDNGEGVEAFLRAHPDEEQQLRQILPTMRAMATIGSADLSPNMSSGTKHDGATLVGERPLGDFRLVREIGRGGMGVVYEAEQLSLPRRVALKVLPFAAILDKRQLQRFQNEARAAATLDHPGIVSIYSVGCDRGVHYYAMQLIEGQTLAQVIGELRQLADVDQQVEQKQSNAASQLANDLASGRFSLSSHSATASSATAIHSESEHHQSPLAAETVRLPRATISTQRSTESPDFCRAVAHLGVQAAEALDHAHMYGVLHRDIKPGNLMLNAEGKLWITDFGLARIEADPGMTVTGDILGTLRYMSPEQVLGKQVMLDHRADIYSLGVTLYEMLTLESAFRGDDRKAILQQIAVEEPRPPCRINKAIPRDLGTIVLKAIRKNPEERYATAQEFADDLKHFLDNEPIRARRPSSLDLISKWVRRHRTFAWSVAAVLLVAVACLAVATAVIGRSLQSTREAQRNTLRERNVAIDNLYISNVRLAQQEWENGNLTAVETLLDTHIPTADQTDLRGWEWYYLKSLCHRDLATLRGHTAGIQTVAWSPDGQRLASAGEDFLVRVWDAATHEQLQVLSGHSNHIPSLAWSPDGSKIASASWDKTVRVWDVATGETVLEILASEAVLRHVAWSPNGLRLATCGDDSLGKIWDAKTGEELMQLKGHTGVVWSLVWSPDGSRLASGDNYENREIRIWDAATGKLIKQISEAHGHAILDVAWSPDGRQLATASVDQTVGIWDAETGERRQVIDAHDGTVTSVSWSPDGAQLATSGGDGSVKIWNARDGRLLNVLRGHLGAVRSVQWRSDGERLASGSTDSTVKVWDPHQEQLFTKVRGRGGFSWSPDGRRLATVFDSEGDDQGAVMQIMEMESSVIQQLPFPRSDKSTMGLKISWSPDGSRIACSGYASDTSACVTKVFDRATLARIYSLEPPYRSDLPEVRSIAWSPDGRYLATAIFDGPVDGYVILWEMATGKKVVRLRQRGPVDSVAWSPDSTRVASSSWFQIVKIWEVGTWREILTLHCHPDFLGDAAGGDYKVAWTPDGSRLAAGTARGWLIIWDASTGREVLSFKAHTALIRSIAISPDGLRIATASKDRSVKIWDTAGRQLLTLRGHDGQVDTVGWSPSGDWLISSGGGGLRLWDGSRETGKTD